MTGRRGRECGRDWRSADDCSCVSHADAYDRPHMSDRNDNPREVTGPLEIPVCRLCGDIAYHVITAGANDMVPGQATGDYLCDEHVKGVSGAVSMGLDPVSDDARKMIMSMLYGPDGQRKP